jgi:sucrose phosphorylase
LGWITGLANSLGLELLPEVLAPYATQFKLAAHGYWIYDFILPYSILETLLHKTSVNLREYLKIRPPKQFTMLDCHDGVPVKPDLNGLYKSQEAKKLVNTCLQRGANLSLIFSPKHKDPDGFDVHQIRCAYYSMLNCDDDAYLAARAIQFFVPGVPQVYYVGLLAGENDEENIKKTGDGREINRHNFSIEEIDQAVQKDVVQRLLKLIRFRNGYPAFNGEFKVLDFAQDEVRLSWQKDDKICTLNIDLKTSKSVIEYLDEMGQAREYRP